MSDNEDDFQDIDSEQEYEYDMDDEDDQDYASIAAAPAPRQALPIQRAPRIPPHYQAQPRALPPFQQMMMNPGAFQAGFGGHAFARPPAEAFRAQYKAYSTAMLEIQQGRNGQGRSNLMYGGKIVMPPSALHELTQLDIELPITFQITNPANPDLNTHVGVLEFIAEEGTVNLPQWIMDQLRLDEGSPIRIWGARFPKGKMIKIQAQSVDFLEVSDPKAVLEQALRNFSCLSAGDIIEIDYNSLQFRLLIMEITPPGPAISVLDTDLEVDFAAPLGYVEPEYKPRSAAPTMKDKLLINTKGTDEVDGTGRGSGANTPNGSSGGGGRVFEGTGQSLGGKRVKGKGMKKKIEALEADSKILRTDKPRIITSDTHLSGRQVPSALVLPFGNLFFGYDNLPPPPGTPEEIAAAAALAAATPAVPFASVGGSGNTLSGRRRAAPSAGSGSATPVSMVASSRSTSVAPGKAGFEGKGQSMSGRKPIDTIVIDDD